MRIMCQLAHGSRSHVMMRGVFITAITSSRCGEHSRCTHALIWQAGPRVDIGREPNVICGFRGSRFVAAFWLTRWPHERCSERGVIKSFTLGQHV